MYYVRGRTASAALAYRALHACTGPCAMGLVRRPRLARQRDLETALDQMCISLANGSRIFSVRGGFPPRIGKIRLSRCACGPRTWSLAGQAIFPVHAPNYTREKGVASEATLWYAEYAKKPASKADVG